MFIMKRIRIAQFVCAMNCGGTETMLMNLFRNFDKSKYEFVFIENTPAESWYSKEIIKNGGKIVKVSKFSYKNIFSYIKELVNLFKTEKFDVVHSHVFLHSGIVMYAAKKAGIAIRISHSHSAMRRKDNSFLKLFVLRKLMLRYSTKLLACSTEAGICLYGRKFLRFGEVIPNPIQIDKIINLKESHLKAIKNKYNLSNDILVIGHVGRLVDVKNHGFMLKIAKSLKESNIKFKMFFLGDGPLYDQIKQQILNYELENEIVMTGNVSNVVEYMKVFSVLLLPSFYEGLPVTLIEAQASGLYSIVSKNVSSECDLKLGLIDFEEITDEKIWVDKINTLPKKIVSQSKILKTIKLFGYDVASSEKKYEKIYNLNTDVSR